MKLSELMIILEGKWIEKGLKPDHYIDNMTPPKELYHRIVQELKDKGIYHENDSEGAVL
ncbi:hypothetical protein [Lactonifactor longoviformis]|uniref:Uncharacterized protein n=1 Tax=Lactonifactor longoviformis DSM 17459 TaxID=1122155 RepID=A0A1M4VCR0_9CLOT|nr:hypothetical protein [Lactonifactor longoviformis]SHE66736.1 hypothetical protein SAMN02745158_01162 [Lactonifactor longoviformis DSM 17459]